ncbi:MAG: glycosyltransferase family 2 protein [Desulfobacterales bacterium]
MNQRILVVIPAFNEEKTIASIIGGLRDAAPDFDRVVVNDGSKDDTGEIVAALGEKQLLLPCNLGYGRALQTGLRYALLKGYDLIVSFDADGQHHAEDVPRLIFVLNQSGADLVIGSRYYHKQQHKTTCGRRLGQLIFSCLTLGLMGRRIYDTTSGFRALSRGACEVIVDGAFMDFHTETIVKLGLSGFDIVEVPITMEERCTGRSMHSFASIFHYPLQTVLLTIVAVVDSLLTRRAKWPARESASKESS